MRRRPLSAVSCGFHRSMTLKALLHRVFRLATTMSRKGLFHTLENKSDRPHAGMAIALKRSEGTNPLVDKATKQLLKQPDQFVSLTGQGLDWANRNRRTAS